MYTNYNLTDIKTPVDVQQFERLLKMSQYDKDEIRFLCEGFVNGFDLGYKGPRDICQNSPNLKFRVGSKIILWNKVMKEVKLGRYARPYEQVPFDHYIQSPIGLVPKDNGKDVRLIFHLSYPRNPSRGYSINGNTPKHLSSVTYPDFMEAVQMCIQEGVGCHICKSDMSAAFRKLGMSRSSWPLLIMMAQSPIDNRWYYFVDKCLPFGAAISWSHFQHFSNAVAHIVKHKNGDKKPVNYLDDFLFAALLKLICNMRLQTFLDVCAQIKFPVSIEKTFWASTSMTFLGFLIDTIVQTISIPVEKVGKANDLLVKLLNKGKTTVKQWQSPCGFLNFIGRCILPGRAFTRRLYALTANPKLKPHHHVRINAETRLDLQMWHKFIQHASIFSRLFMDYSDALCATEIDFYTDASGTIGFGGVCGNSWMYGSWPQNFLDQDPSIEFKELYALVAGALGWLDRFRNKRIIVFCDNQSVVAMVNSTSSSCKRCMILIRLFVLHCLKLNVRLYGRYVNTKANVRADLLSRNRIV